MFIDEWYGMCVYCLKDVIIWEKQGVILDKFGICFEDMLSGVYGDVVVVGDKVYVIYFIYFGCKVYFEEIKDEDGNIFYYLCCLLVQVVELLIKDGQLVVDCLFEFNFYLFDMEE